ncbi:MAG: ferritin-like domain-containing protein [Candidatus Binatia bacterium]
MLEPGDPRLVRLLSYYRDAELHGAGLLLHMAAMEEDPRSLASLPRHMADESRHAALITRRITDLGGAPQRVRDGYQRRMARAGGPVVRMSWRIDMTEEYRAHSPHPSGACGPNARGGSSPPFRINYLRRGAQAQSGLCATTLPPLPP